MKKTVFEGKVNGQVFDNINDYNACLQAMLDMGENVEASSNTKIINLGDTCCEDGCECVPKCECEQCKAVENKPLKANVNFLPGFGTDNKSSYIDNLVTLDDSEFDSRFAEAKESMEKIFDEVKIALTDSTNTLHKKEVYLKKVRDIIGVIDEDYTKNRAALVNINNRINSFEEELNMLKETQDTLCKAEAVIEMYGDWYDMVQDMIEDDLIQPENNEVVETTEKVVKEPVSVSLGGFENLLKAVFGK